MTVTEQFAAHVSIQSRECGTGLLERLIGPELLVDRTVAAAIVGATRRVNGSVLCVTTPDLVDLESQVEYFLTLLPRSPEETAVLRDRVVVISLRDASTRWLSTKLLDPENPEAGLARDRVADYVDRMRRSGQRVKLSYFEPSEALERFAQHLGIPGDQASARHIPLGTKGASRRLFARAGIPVPPGTSEVHSTEALAEQLAALVRRGVRRFVLKLSSTEYGAGYGNATLDLRMLAPNDDDEDLVEALHKHLPSAHVIDERFGWSGFEAAVPRSGVIGEELVEGEELRSPSYQGRISASGVVTISTHEQVLAGNRQTFVGSSFPAAEAYRTRVMEYGLRIGAELRAEGVDQGDYGVDFVVVRRAGGWHILGCEINLRATAAKHGFDMVTALLGVQPNSNGELLVEGRRRVYLASDAVASPDYVGLMPRQLIEAVRCSSIHYDHTTGRGVVLHMLSGLPVYGKFGAVCIGSSMTEAEQLMRDLRGCVNDLVSAADR
jgi:PGM1 C-terminal domain